MTSDGLVACELGWASLDERGDAFLEVSGRSCAIAHCGNSSNGGGLARVEQQSRIFDHLLQCDRCAGEHLGRQLECPSHLFTRCRHLLHEADPVRLGSVELIGREKVIHRVAPTSTLDISNGGATDCGQASLRFELAEPGVGGGNDDVAGQGKLDPHREGDALHCGDERLRQTTLQSERIDRVRWPLRRLCIWPEEQRHFEASGCVLACEGEHADPEVSTAVQLGERITQLRQDLRRQRVAFLHPVDGHVEDVLMHGLGHDLTVRMAIGVSWFRHETYSRPSSVTESTTIRCMTRTDTSAWPCTIARSANVLGDGWNLLIMRQACLGTRRFGDFQVSLGIGRAILSSHLNQLVDEGLLVRKQYQERPQRSEYRLTDKGRDVYPILAAMAAWGGRWLTGPEGSPLTLHHSLCDHDMTAKVTCSVCDEVLNVHDVSAIYGPGHPQSEGPSVSVEG